MKWNGRYYRPGYGIPVYPKKESSIEELLKPLGEKKDKGNVWIPVLNQPINILKETTPVPPTTLTPTPSQTPTQTPTGSPTSTPTPTPTPTPTTSQVLVDHITTENNDKLETESGDFLLTQQSP
jgi:hypothetical protein